MLPGLKVVDEDAPQNPTYRVGQRVRVLSERGEVSRLAVISVSHGNLDSVHLVGIFRARNINTYDVIYDGKDMTEECNVPEFRIMAVEEFEMQAAECDDATLWKDRGNVLFAKKDFAEAVKCYQKSLSCVSGVGKLPVIGNSVLCISGHNDTTYPVGIVSYIESQSSTSEVNAQTSQPASIYEILLPEGDEVHLSAEQLVILSDSEEESILQHSVYKNLSRCMCKLHYRGWAVRYANLAYSIMRYVLQTREADVQGDAGDSANLQKQYVDALYFRAKVLVEVGRPHTAILDAQELAGFAADKARDIQQLARGNIQKKQQADKKLAKELARWVGQVMEGAGGDLDMEEEGLGDDDSSVGGAWDGGSIVRKKPDAGGGDSKGSGSDSYLAESDRCESKEASIEKRHQAESVETIGTVHVLAVSLVLVLVALWCRDYVAYFATVAYFSRTEGDGFT